LQSRQKVEYRFRGLRRPLSIALIIRIADFEVETKVLNLSTEAPNISPVAALDKALDVQVSSEPRAQRATPAAYSAWRKGDIVLLTALTLLFLFLRITWAVTRNVVIENEGAEYTRIAVNLAAGNGYVGLMGGPHLVDSPLYPVLIRTGLFFTYSPVASARAVSIAAGTLLVPLVFLIASTAYGRRPAWIAAAISGLHPFLIGFSASTYADCLYTTLLAGTVYFAILSLRLPPIRWFIALGSLLGLAYLTKGEMIAEMAVLPVLISGVGAWKHRLKYALSGALIVLACCALFASPYVVYLYRHAHHLRLEGVSEPTFVITARINAGMDPYRAANGLSDTGQEEGPLLSTQHVFGRSAYPHTLREFARFFLLAVSRNLRGLYEGLALYVWLPLLILCLFGLFRSAWSQERALVELVLLSTFALACIPVLIAPYVTFRLVLPVMPFVVIWAAKGIDELGDWVQHTVDNLTLVKRPGVYLCIATIVLLSAIILILGEKNARHVDNFKEADATSIYLKETGLALAKRANGNVIVDTGTVVAFYSGATWMGMPFGPTPVILRYFEQHHPDFIVINHLIRQEDDLAEALKKDPHARPLPLNLRSPLTVYEWKQQPSPGSQSWAGSCDACG
jgi:4-amino-4-deoxy-L-arabinose transferase-like glycosyltransferase